MVIFCSRGSQPPPKLKSYISIHAARNKNIYDLGLGISTVFKIFGHSLFHRTQDFPVGSYMKPTRTYHVMPLHTRNKNKYGYRVLTATVFKIFGHFLFLGGQDQSLRSWPTYHVMPLDTRNKNIYGQRMF